MSARIVKCSEAEYFADSFCDVPSLSQSIAHKLLTESPLHAWAAHPRLGGAVNNDDDEDDKEKKDLLRGKVIHRLLLGRGAEFAIIEHDSYRSNAAKADRDAAIAAGKTPIKIYEFDDMERTANTLRRLLAARGVIFSGSTEVPIVWEEGSCVCRSRIDHILIGDDAVMIDELKTIRSAHPDTCARHFYSYGYDIQRAAYTRAVQALYPDREVTMRFVYVEPKPPYAITIARPGAAYIDIGEARWLRAVESWQKCMTNQVWPDYSKQAGEIILEPQPFVVEKELGNVW